MFKPRTLKEVISLARMKDDQLSGQRKFLRQPLPILPPTQALQTVPIKRLPWDEMQRRRAQGLCFILATNGSPLVINVKGLNFYFLKVPTVPTRSLVKKL